MRRISRTRFNSGRLLAGVLTVVITGCAGPQPYVGRGPHPQVVRGAPFPPVDLIGNVLALPAKLILWNWQFALHYISPETEDVLIAYLDAKNLPSFEDTQYQLNQYAPFQDLKRLVKNRHIGWPYRLFLGLPTTLIYDVLLPGRIVPFGDYYNPFTNTVHLFSDDPAIALHEAGHAYDFADFPMKGTYALTRQVPFINLTQEWEATENAIEYLQESKQRARELRAYEVLWPAYGTYIGGYMPIPYVGPAIGALFGHGAGRLKAREQREYYERMDAVLSTPDQTIENIKRMELQ